MTRIALVGSSPANPASEATQSANIINAAVSAGANAFKVRGEWLKHEQVLQLHSAIIRAVGADYIGLRNQLLAGIHPGYVASLPLANDSVSQLLLDLGAMNRVERLVGDTVPLSIFGANLAALANGGAPVSAPVKPIQNDALLSEAVAVLEDALRGGARSTYLSHDAYSKVMTGLRDGLGAEYPKVRRQLFAGILPGFVATLAVSPTPMTQIALDLMGLNRVSKLADGSIPLAVFTANLKALYAAGAQHGPDQVHAAVDKLNGLAVAKQFTGAADRFNERPTFTFDSDVGDGRPGVKRVAGRLRADADAQAFLSAMMEAVTQAGFPGMPVTFEIHE